MTNLDTLRSNIVKNIVQKCQSISVKEVSRGKIGVIDEYYSIKGIIGVLEQQLSNKELSFIISNNNDKKRRIKIKTKTKGKD